ncbi:MAG: arginine--tRNA ligase, partial [Verrucomicrobiota bacterium]
MPLWGLAPDITLGESFYRDKVDRIYDELTACGLAEESEGALVVFHPEHPRFAKQPFIIRKADGASNYASTDLATLLYRREEFGADEIVYLTDGRQRDHFEQLFLTAEKWFTKQGYTLPKLTHVWWGTILGEDGKAIKTRSGEPIYLAALLDEAIERARTIVEEKSPDLPDEEKAAIATAVGLGAVRYADLSQNRTQDYVFAWDKLLAFEGNSAPYLLMAVARVHSIFRKAGVDLDATDFEAEASVLETDEELTLAGKLMNFPEAIALAASDLRPHHLCTYLYELAGEFSTFFNANRVIIDEADV